MLRILHRRIPTELMRCVAAVALLAVLGSGPMLAAETEKPGRVQGSLNFIPADAAFYSASLRNQEQLEIIAGSKAWEKLNSIASVKLARGMLEAQWNEPGGQMEMARAMLELPENQELLALANEMFAEEIFLYGDNGFARLFDLYFIMMGSANTARFSGILGMNAEEGVDEEVAVARTLLDTLQENLDAIETPELVIGFKIKDRKRAETQLKRLEILAGLALSQYPEWKPRLQRAKVGDASFLTFKLDGGLIPWDDIPWEKAELEEGEYDQVKEKLKQLTLAISLGIEGDYLLLSIGSSNEHLKDLTEPKETDRLVDRAEFKPLLAAGDQRFIGIAYASAEMRRVFATQAEDLDGLAVLAEHFLLATELPQEAQERIIQDAQELADDLKPLLPEVGATLSYSFLTERGIESLSYDWTKDRHRDASRPLELLSHLGGNPIAGVVARSKPAPEQYDTAAKWLTKAFGYFEEFGVPQMPEEQQAKFQQYRKLLLPAADRLHRVNREMLLPALADGQLGLVLDAQLELNYKSSGEQDPLAPLQMLAADPRLRLPEPALLIGVKDARLLKKAMAEYREIANEIVAGIRKIEPDLFPEFQIPEPKTKQLKQGTVYWYPLPQEVGNLVPCAALSENVAVLAISHGHAGRLLSRKPLQAAGLLANPKQAFASASYFSWTRFVDAALPWAEFGIRSGLERPGTDPKADPEIEAILEQVRTGAEVLKAFRESTSVTYLKDDTTVTHSESHFKDLE